MRYNHSIEPSILRELISYNADTGILTWNERVEKHFPNRRAWKIWNTRYAGKPAFCRIRGYLRIRVTGQALFAHRVAWAIYHGRWPIDQLDHINGITDDNRIQNLREVNNAENSRNSKKPAHNKSGRIGVNYLKKNKKWRAEIGYEGSNFHLGSFDTFEAACAAREWAEKQLGFSENHGR
jgi:hypothetical protein